MMIYSCVIAEIREFVYTFEAIESTDQTDAINKFVSLNPEITTPSYAFIIQGPTQIDLSVQSLCDAARGDSYQFKGQLQLIQGTPTFSNPFSQFYTATLREVRLQAYFINCDVTDQNTLLNSIVEQLNPSNPILPNGVTLATTLQQNSVNPVCLIDPFGITVNWWV